ncbi:glycine-rich domain-containing protein, partial [Pseudomonas savastanoi]
EGLKKPFLQKSKPVNIGAPARFLSKKMGFFRGYLEAEIGIQYYRNLLYINKKYQRKYNVLPPLLEVDEIWHHHILDTRAYITDCEHIFGYYFHHYPYFGTRGEKDKKNLRIAFKLVQDLYKEEFGYYMTNIWE